jgi:hypothetical protein
LTLEGRNNCSATSATPDKGTTTKGSGRAVNATR